MRIICKKSKRFICEINIEEYLKNLEDIGISQQIPLKIKTRCRACKEDETYLVFKDRYIYKSVDK